MLIDNELHHEDIAHRIPEVAEAMGLSPVDYRGWLKVVFLRGDLRGIPDLTKIMEKTPHGEYGLIILEAFYRILPDGTSENDNAGRTHLVRAFDASTNTR
jgi:hypothetical protein